MTKAERVKRRRKRMARALPFVASCGAVLGALAFTMLR